MPFRYFLIISPLFWVSFVGSEESLLPRDDPKLYYSMMELVCSEGYHVQEHKLVTPDGYILRIYRIPGGKRRPKVGRSKKQYYFLHTEYHLDFESCVAESLNETVDGPAVLLSHGLSAASDCWVLQGANRDLAYILADRGYDVWFANIRGNFYSKLHKTLRPQERAFWDFSFHENGIYDMTSTIDYILDFRGLKKLFYIGHSMGTTIFFVMASMRPEYNEKVTLFIGLTPVAHIRRCSFALPLRRVLQNVVLLSQSFFQQGILQVVPRNNFTNYFTRRFCTNDSPSWLQNLCYDTLFFFTGYSTKLFKRGNLAMYMTHGFSGSSVKSFLHYGQLLDAPAFQHYDYGPEENLRRYAQAEPPIYDLKKITAPVALFYSELDYIAQAEDVENLKKYLPNLVASRRMNEYSHVDFIWAYNAKDILYGDLLQLLSKFGNR